jgi:hypothetical protein
MMKQPILIIVMMLLLSISVTALTGWEGFGNQQDSINREGTLNSIWTTPADDQVSVSAGSDYQPVLADWDDDGQVEMVQIMLTNTVVISRQELNTEDNSIIFDVDIFNTFIMDNVSQTHPTFWEHPSTGNKLWVTVAGDRLYALDYSGTGSPTQVFANTSIVDTCSRWNGMKCKDEYCYALCENDGIVTRAVRFDMVNGNYTLGANLTNGTASVNTALKTNGAPAITAVGSGTAGTRIAFACDPNRDTKYGLCVIRGDTLDYDTTFASTGRIDGLQNTLFNDGVGVATHLQAIANPIYSHLDTDGVGFQHILFAYFRAESCSGGGGSLSPCYSAYSSTGVATWTTCGSSIGSYVDTTQFLQCTDNAIIGLPAQATNRMSQPFVAVINDDLKFCGSQTTSHTLFSGTISHAVMGCLNGTNGARNIFKNFGQIGTTFGEDYFGSVTTPTSTIFNHLAFQSDDLDNDQFIVGNLVFRMNTSFSNTTPQVVLNFTSSELVRNDESISFYDLNGDGNGDIITSGSSPSITRVISNFEEGTFNAPPDLFTNLSGAGYFNYNRGATCKGTNVTFRAQECPGTGSGCNYNNDRTSDTERIRTDCGAGTTTIGALHAGLPQVSCVYNTTGTFQVVLYLQDQANLFNLEESNEDDVILINVIDGIPGTTCNIGSQFVSSPGAQPSTVATPQQEAIDQSVDDTLGILFGTSALLKLLASLGIIIAIMYGLVSEGIRNSFLIGSAGVLTMIGLTAIGLLSVYVSILFFVGIILIFIITTFVSSGREGG